MSFPMSQSPSNGSQSFLDAQPPPPFGPSPTGHSRSTPSQQQQQHQQRQQQQTTDSTGTARADDPAFDIFEWAPKYASCQRYFLDHAQHSGPVQAVAAFLNIHLPYQRHPATLSSSIAHLSPVLPHSSSASSAGGAAAGISLSAAGASSSSSSAPKPGSNPATAATPVSAFLPAPAISLIPYLRRLVVTGLDFPGVLHGFFGDDWAAGIGPLHEQERRNLLFAAKSGGWAGVKRDYDMLPLETVPFLRPLQGVVEAEVVSAEKSWSEWLALEDWMVGPRAPMHGEPRGGGGGGGGGGAGGSGMGGMDMSGSGGIS